MEDLAKEYEKQAKEDEAKRRRKEHLLTLKQMENLAMVCDKQEDKSKRGSALRGSDKSNKIKYEQVYMMDPQHFVRNNLAIATQAL